MTSPLQVRLIDPRGHRFGAALSVVFLVVGFALDAPIVPALIALALGISATFGTKYSALGRPWPTIRRLLELGPPASPEPELGPRFAQGFGSVVLVAGIVLMAAGLPVLGWLLVGAVGALQTLLAVTGICVGCQLYGLHWWLPAMFDRFVLRLPASRDESPGPA
jgi:Domain of unknown function (DUF4395)